MNKLEMLYIYIANKAIYSLKFVRTHQLLLYLHLLGHSDTSYEVTSLLFLQTKLCSFARVKKGDQVTE